MKMSLENTALRRIYSRIQDWYHQGAFAAFFQVFRTAYPYSVFQRFWTALCSTPLCDTGTSWYVRRLAGLRHFMELLGDALQTSVLYRVLTTIGHAIAAASKGGLLGRLCSCLGMRGLLLCALALYMPLDVLLRALPLGFISSSWDEALMLFAAMYILWRVTLRRAPLQMRATPVDAYLLLFIAVGFFLMCVNSPIMNIAVSGYRAVVQYMVWFLLVTRLIEDDHDFHLFYGVLLGMAILVGLHGIYQYIVAAPIPANWISSMEAPVRTRVYSIIGSPNIMGSFLVMFAPMAAGVAYYSKTLWIKIAAICATGMMCLSIIFTFSKGAWGGLFVAVFVFAVFLDRRLIALMGVAGTAAIVLIPSIMNRIMFMFTSAYHEASMRAGRMIRWQKGLELLHENNPWIGFGLGRFGGAVAMQNQTLASQGLEYFYLDNYYLKTLVEMGYIGLFFYILLLAGLILWCLRAIGRSRYDKEDRSRVLAVAMFSGLCGVLTHCFFENIFEVPYMTAYFWSLAAAVMYWGYFRKRAPQRNKK